MYGIGNIRIAASVIMFGMEFATKNLSVLIQVGAIVLSQKPLTGEH